MVENRFLIHFSPFSIQETCTWLRGLLRVEGRLRLLGGELLLLALDVVAQNENEQAPGESGEDIPPEGRGHCRVQAGVF